MGDAWLRHAWSFAIRPTQWRCAAGGLQGWEHWSKTPGG